MKKSVADEACRRTPNCEYIGYCNVDSWNGRHPDSVQLYRGPLSLNVDWQLCRPRDEIPGSAGADFLLMILVCCAFYMVSHPQARTSSHSDQGSQVIDSHLTEPDRRVVELLSVF
eukprot:SAG31_NODE_11697_length_1005_cov_2.133554_1_plen_114_part_10